MTSSYVFQPPCCACVVLEVCVGQQVGNLGVTEPHGSRRELNSYVRVQGVVIVYSARVQNNKVMICERARRIFVYCLKIASSCGY